MTLNGFVYLIIPNFNSKGKGKKSTDSSYVSLIHVLEHFKVKAISKKECAFYLFTKKFYYFFLVAPWCGRKYISN